VATACPLAQSADEATTRLKRCYLRAPRSRTPKTVPPLTALLLLPTKTLLGVRIKTISGDTGTVFGVTYSDITLSGITEYGIIVDQAYDGTEGSPTNGVTITKCVLDNVKGAVESSATNILIECGSGSCSSWTWTDVSVTGGKTSSSSLNVPSGASCSD
jgi:hypothetical protein